LDYQTHFIGRGDQCDRDRALHRAVHQGVARSYSGVPHVGKAVVMKGMFAYLMIFLVLITAITIWGNYDTITPAVAQAQADMSIGAGPVQVIEKGASWLLKLVAGATFAGIFAVVLSEGRKIYKAWMRSSHTRRWLPGPNAQYRQQSSQQMPKLSRTDLMLMALIGRSPNQGSLPKMGSVRNQSDSDDEIDLEF